MASSVVRVFAVQIGHGTRRLARLANVFGQSLLPAGEVVLIEEERRPHW